jgi:hypothetical protein
MVNKDWFWEGSEHLPEGAVCLLSISEEKNSVGIKYLPATSSHHWYNTLQSVEPNKI